MIESFKCQLSKIIRSNQIKRDTDREWEWGRERKKNASNYSTEFRVCFSIVYCFFISKLCHLTEVNAITHTDKHKKWEKEAKCIHAVVT